MQYVCISDFEKFFEDKHISIHLRKWITNVDTIQFLGKWEKANNPDFDTQGMEVFLNRIRNPKILSLLPPIKWIQDSNAIGVLRKVGRYGGFFAHPDIALHFMDFREIDTKIRLSLVEALC